MPEMAKASRLVPMNSSIIEEVYHYSKSAQKRIRLGLLFSFLNKVFDIAPEILIGFAVDLVVRKQQSFIAHIGFEEPHTQLLFLGALTFVIWAMESLFQYLYEIQWKSVAQELQHNFRIDAYRHVQNLDLSWHSDNRIGNVQSILNDDINQLERFLNFGVNEIVQVVSSTLLIGAIFFYISPIIALGTVLPIPLIFLGISLFQKRLRPLYLGVRQKAGNLGAKIESNLLGMMIVKAFTAEDKQARSIEAASIDYQNANRKAIYISSAFVPLIRFAILLGFLLTLVWGGYLTLSGKLPVGSYSVLIFLTQRFLWPFTRLGEVVDNFSRAFASAERIFTLLHTPIRAQDHGNNQYQITGGDIQFSHVDFCYANNPAIIHDFNLHVPARNTIAFVGPTGSGKSTLVNLLLRFYEPTKGEIKIDGVKLEDYSLAHLRQHIAYVAQDAMLFPCTIAENIAFGVDTIDEANLVRAAQLAEAHGFISKLPQGYQTDVGERGVKLSGGQRQRIAIARAIYKNAPIIIFDEATSAVDNETEAAIQRSLEHISKSITTIVIAHRLSTIRHVDCIYVIKDGTIVEHGTHDELVKKGEFYSSLWDIQTGNINHLHL